MSTSAAPDVLEIVEIPDLAETDERSGHGFLKGIVISVGIAVIAAAIAKVFSRRGD